MIGDLWLSITPAGRTILVDTEAGFKSALKDHEPLSKLRFKLLGNVVDFDQTLKVWSDEAREAARAARAARAEEQYPSVRGMDTLVGYSRKYTDAEKEVVDRQAKKALNGHPPEMLMDALGEKGATVKVRAGHNGVQITVNSDIYTMVAQYTPDRSIYVEHLVMDSKAHAAGYFRSKCKGLLETADKIGSGSIYIVAGLDDGSYSWARMGFKPLDASTFQVLKAGVVNGAEGLTDEDERRLLSTSNIRDLAGFKSSSGRRVGKELMKGMEWQGELKLDDRDPNYRIFKRYIGRK